MSDAPLQLNQTELSEQKREGGEKSPPSVASCSLAAFIKMAPPPGYDAAALGWYSSKRSFKRKYVCVRPKYTAAKLEGIKRHIYRIKMEQLVIIVSHAHVLRQILAA